MLVGAYTEVEMSNCHSAAFGQAYVHEYLAPVSNHVVALHQRLPGLAKTPFIFADVRASFQASFHASFRASFHACFHACWIRIFNSIHNYLPAQPYYVDRPSCLSPAAYGDFWRRAFLAAPGFSLIAPQDGVGAHNLSQSTVRAFMTALRNGSHAALVCTQLSTSCPKHCPLFIYLLCKNPSLLH